MYDTARKIWLKKRENIVRPVTTIIVDRNSTLEGTTMLKNLIAKFCEVDDESAACQCMYVSVCVCT